MQWKRGKGGPLNWWKGKDCWEESKGALPVFHAGRVLLKDKREQNTWVETVPAGLPHTERDGNAEGSNTFQQITLK